MADKTFTAQLNNSRCAEYLVKIVMEERLHNTVVFTDRPEQHKGDMLVTNASGSKRAYLEVKRDSSIGRTNNMFIELAVIRGNQHSKGWFDYDYSYIAVVDTSKETMKKYKRPIYIINFRKMKLELDQNNENVQYGERAVNADGNGERYLLVKLDYIRQQGWLHQTYHYTDKDWRRAVQMARDNPATPF